MEYFSFIHYNLNIENNWEKERNKQIERISADGVRSSFKPQ